MSEYKTEYMQKHCVDIMSILNLGDELPLVHTPDISMQGNTVTNVFEVYAAGKPARNIPAETLESEIAIAESNAGTTRLITLSARAAMHLLSSEISAAIPSKNATYSIDETKNADDIAHRAQSLMYDGKHIYTSYRFIDENSNEIIEIQDAQLFGESDLIHARDFMIGISDDYVRKEITISQLPSSFTGKKTLDVEQVIKPIKNEVVTRAVRFLETNNALELYGAVFKIICKELTGPGNTNAEANELIAKFDDTEKINELKSIIEQIKEYATTAKANSTFILNNSEFALPSAEELQNCISLLSDIRS